MLRLKDMVAQAITPAVPTSALASVALQSVQDAARFPWLTVRGNVELAVRLRGVSRKERRSQAEALLQLVHLGEFIGKRPHELSGGMRQRVALARAFAQDADVLLMDEPFGALDAMTPDILHHELERLWADRSLTMVFVGGLKQGWAFAWRSLMAGQLLVITANQPSIGFQLQGTRDPADYSGMQATMLLILIIGIVVDALFFGTLSARSAGAGGCWRYTLSRLDADEGRGGPRSHKRCRDASLSSRPCSRSHFSNTGARG